MRRRSRSMKSLSHRLRMRFTASSTPPWSARLIMLCLLLLLLLLLLLPAANPIPSHPPSWLTLSDKQTWTQTQTQTQKQTQTQTQTHTNLIDLERRQVKGGGKVVKCALDQQYDL